MRPALLVPLLLLVTACSSPVTQQQIQSTLAGSLAAARGHAAADQHLEAFQLVHAIESVDPAYPGLAEVRDGLEGEAEPFSRPWAGINRPVRHPVDSGIGARIGWYLPDRILDILDVFSFDVHVGFGVYVDAHATRWLGLAVGGRVIGGFGWHEHRSLGVQAKGEGGLSVLAFDGSGRFASRAGTSGVDAWGGGHGGVMTPGDGYFQEYMDFWALGASVTGGLAGAEVDVHPLEIFDLLVGWFLFDPLGDDFATTRGLELSDPEWDQIRTLARIAADEEALAEYRGEAPAADG